jgi:C-terminal processing protease CtpA/Prc
LREFGISHIRLFTPKAAEQRRTGTQLGFGFSALPEARGLAISAVVPDSPAAKLGLEAGDIITRTGAKTISFNLQASATGQDVFHIITAVPEASTSLGLLALGAGGLLTRRRQKRKA